jgi:hypothetical protein
MTTDATTYTVWHRVIINGRWEGLATSHLTKKNADDRAYALIATGSKNVMVLPEVNGEAETPDVWQFLEMNTFGVFIDTAQIRATIHELRAGTDGARERLRTLLVAANPNTRSDEIARALVHLAAPID